MAKLLNRSAGFPASQEVPFGGGKFQTPGRMMVGFSRPDAVVFSGAFWYTRHNWIGGRSRASPE